MGFWKFDSTLSNNERFNSSRIHEKNHFVKKFKSLRINLEKGTLALKLKIGHNIYFPYFYTFLINKCS